MLHQQFAFRPRNEDVWIHFKGEGAEFLLARNVLHRLALHPATKMGQKGVMLRVTEGAMGVNMEIEARQRQHVGEENFGVG